MKIKLKFGERAICLPGKALERLSDADAVELRLLLTLAGQGSGAEIDPDALGEQMGLSGEDVRRGLDFWRGAGVLKLDEDSAKTVRVSEHESGGAKVSVVHSGPMPTYTGQEIERLYAENGQLQGLVDECQRNLGKMLSVGEINKIIGLCDYYRLSGDYILLLVKRCVEIGKGTVPYIVRTAVSLYNEGIVSIEALEDRFRDDDEISAMESTLRTLMGWGKRALTEKEKKFIQNWTRWEIPDDMLRMVYEITVDATKGPSMPYMNKILTSWREAGYKTAADAQAAMEQYRQKRAASGSSFDRDEFFEAAIRRSLESHGKG